MGRAACRAAGPDSWRRGQQYASWRLLDGAASQSYCDQARQPPGTTWVSTVELATVHVEKSLLVGDEPITHIDIALGGDPFEHARLRGGLGRVRR